MLSEYTPDDSLARTSKYKTFTVLIGKYHVRNYSPTGRGTKGYIAYVLGEEREERLVFIKMGWRPESTSITPELETYKTLYKKNVEHIAQVLGGGDVYHDPFFSPTACDAEGKARQLRTVSQDFIQGDADMLPRVQYRLVVETLGIPLGEYFNSFALVCAVFQAFNGECV